MTDGEQVSVAPTDDEVAQWRQGAEWIIREAKPGYVTVPLAQQIVALTDALAVARRPDDVPAIIAGLQQATWMKNGLNELREAVERLVLHVESGRLDAAARRLVRGGNAVEPVEAQECVICHASIRPEDSGLCDDHKYDEQRPLVIPAAAKLQPGELIRYLGPGSWELVDSGNVCAVIEAHLSTGIGCRCQNWRPVTTGDRFDLRRQHRDHVAEQIAQQQAAALDALQPYRTDPE